MWCVPEKETVQIIVGMGRTFAFWFFQFMPFAAATLVAIPHGIGIAYG
jgi:hypothetical protein